MRLLADRGSATGAELARDEPRLRTQIVAAADNPYGGAVNLTTRLLTLLSAEGLIVRGRPRGGWTSTQFTWSAAERIEQPAAAAARAELARRWLSRVRPGPRLRPAVVDRLDRRAGQAGAGRLDVAEADLDGAPGIMLAADAASRTAPTGRPWPALLPALDPTAMGWRERGWYVGEHTGPRCSTGRETSARRPGGTAGSSAAGRSAKTAGSRSGCSKTSARRPRPRSPPRRNGSRNGSGQRGSRRVSVPRWNVSSPASDDEYHNSS